jgi:hypothetical protein
MNFVNFRAREHETGKSKKSRETSLPPPQRMNLGPPASRLSINFQPAAEKWKSAPVRFAIPIVT